MARAPRDHFVPVTYLNRFIDPARVDRVHVYRKLGENYSAPRPETICVERGGDLNPYYQDPTILRDYLQVLEPRWAQSVDALIENPDDLEARFIIAGLITMMMSWVPAVRRVQTTMLEQNLDAIRPAMAEQARAEGEDEDLIAGLLDPQIVATVDPNYPRAMAIQNMARYAARFFEGGWMLTQAPEGQHFITSDNPAVKLYLNEADMIGKTQFALSPQWAVTILPMPRDDMDQFDLEALVPGPLEVGVMGDEAFRTQQELMIKSAERIVISSREDDEIQELVEQYKNWGIVATREGLPLADGPFYIFKYRPGPLQGD